MKKKVRLSLQRKSIKSYFESFIERYERKELIDINFFWYTNYIIHCKIKKTITRYLKL